MTKRTHRHQRKWGFPIRWNNGKIAEINLYLYEQVELARHNIAACKKAK